VELAATDVSRYRYTIATHYDGGHYYSAWLDFRLRIHNATQQDSGIYRSETYLFLSLSLSLSLCLSLSLSVFRSELREDNAYYNIDTSMNGVDVDFFYTYAIQQMLLSIKLCRTRSF